jgi:hypothetical protein
LENPTALYADVQYFALRKARARILDEQVKLHRRLLFCICLL